MREIECSISSSLAIKKDSLQTYELENIKNDLTVKAWLYNNDNQYEYHYYYKEMGNIIIIPRYYNKYKFKYINNHITLGEDIDIKWNEDFNLREDKLEIVTILKNNKFGFIRLPTGFGKTILAIKHIAETKKKALILVDREVLLNQWVKSITDTTHFKEEDIGIYKADKHEMDKPIVIAMVQTITSKLKSDFKNTVESFKNSNFGITFVDEAHSVGSQIFSDVRLVLFSDRLYALSATPFRNDKKETQILKWLFGDIIVEKTLSVLANVKVIPFQNSLAPKTYIYINMGGHFNYTNYAKVLYNKDTKFVELVLDTILDIANKTKHKILIPLSIIKTIELLEKTINTNDKYISLRDKYTILTSATKGTYNKEAMIIFATVGLISKGFDDDAISTLMITIPLGSSESFITQLSGRILRTKDFKTEFDIIDFVDTKYAETKKTFINRLNVYKGLKFTIDASTYPF